MTATTARDDIRNPDNKFQKDAIRKALKYHHEEKSTALGEGYDDIYGPAVTVTVYFHASGWYSITHVEAASDEAESRFWNDLRNTVAENPYLFHAT